MNTGRYDLAEVLPGKKVPALPQTAVELLKLGRDEENGPGEFARPIEMDPGLAGQVLKFVNSSYFGFTQDITSIRLAITLVGVRTIKNFALWNAVFSLIPNPKCGPFDLKTLWRDSLRRALFARELAVELGAQDAEEIFTAALLQDMAIPLLANELPNEYEELLALRDGGRRRLSELELERFGWTHGDAAAFVVAQWGLPSTFTRLLKSHASVDDWGEHALDDPALFAIGISSMLPNSIDGCWLDLRETTEQFEKASRLHGGRIRDVFYRVDEKFDAFAPVLNLHADVMPLAEWWDTENQQCQSA